MGQRQGRRRLWRVGAGVTAVGGYFWPGGVDEVQAFQGAVTAAAVQRLRQQ